MPADLPSEHLLRPAGSDDLPGIARLYSRVRAAAEPAMPPAAHSTEEIDAWVTGWDLSEKEVWVVESGDLIGFLALTRTWLDALYVAPEAQRSGVGSALLEVACARRPTGFGLWVFETNGPARAFYRKHGLIELERTDGSENEERAPDIRMAWPGERPLEFLRGQIDEIDRDLARLLARRVALTGAVQVRKPVGGPAGRDPVRERQIAERMAELAPALGAERLARIVDVIITESLSIDV